MKVQLGHNRETEQDNTDPAGRPAKFRTWGGEGGGELSHTQYHGRYKKLNNEMQFYCIHKI